MDEFTNIVPFYLRSYVNSYAIINTAAVDSAPDALICHKNGYIYEVKDKKIINCLYLQKIINQIRYVYLFENDKLVMFYVLLTDDRERILFIIRRWDSRLEVVGTYSHVEKFEIYDFRCLGYPQISITYTERSQESIVEFPINRNKAAVNKSDCEANMNSVTSPLAEKVQIIQRHVDELTEEWYSMRKLYPSNVHAGDFSFVAVNSVEFSSPLEKYIERAKVTAKWTKVIGDKLILGMKIINTCKEVLSDLEFQIYEKTIKDYSYRFFSHSELSQWSNQLFLSKKISSVQPEEEMSIVGAVSVSFLNFACKSNIQMLCCLFSENFKNCLLKETFEIDLADLFKDTFILTLAEKFSVQDMQAIKTVNLETKLKIIMAECGLNCIVSVLEHLKFKRLELKNSETMVFYSTSTFLSNVVVALRDEQINSAQNIILYTSDKSQVYCMVNMLYEFLPDHTNIVLNEG